MAIIELRGVTYRYPVSEAPALREVDLQVPRGQFLAVMGPNGAGKSTLCYAIAGFAPHFFKGQMSGTVQVAGLDSNTATLNDWVLRTGLVFQNPFNQISGAKYTVYEEVAFGLENLGVPREEMTQRVQRALTLTGIRELGDRSPYSLSGGQQQRVALASILVMEPQVLVLDEPTSQLDPAGSREVFGVIREMAGRGMTVVMAEHKVEWIAQFADRVIALDQGRILLDGAPGDVLTSPLLEERGFGISRYSSAARKAAALGLWPEDRPLPVTLEQAVEGFRLR